MVLGPISDVMAQPESHRPAQAKPYKALARFPVAHGSGFTFLKPRAVAQAAAWLNKFEIERGISVQYQKEYIHICSY